MEAFEPFRVVGSVCGPVPIHATLLYGNPVLMVAAGRSFQLYKGKELAMIRGGPTFLDLVETVAQAGKYRFVGEGPRIHAFVHHKPLWSQCHHEMTKPRVRQLLARDDLLFVLGEDKRVAVRRIKTGEVLQEMLVQKSETATAMQLLPGYTNKLLLATEEGSLQLYNFKTGECVWYAERKEAHHPILSLCCSPYTDIIAYGTSAGKVVVYNCGSDEAITTFQHQDGSAVTALTFRVDKEGLLVSGTSRGEVVMWDLTQRSMDGLLTRSKQVRSATEVLETPHMNAVHSLIVFEEPKEAQMLLVTGGADNAMMQFRLDTVDGLAVLTRERRGHMGSCTTARFYNSDLLITAGNDRAVRATHLFSDRASWELSQGKLGKKGRDLHLGREALKMPPATALATCTTRNYQWSSIASIHSASSQMCGWRMDSRSMEMKLSGITTTSHTARCVTISDCGNFAVVGYSSGNVSIINLQSRSIRQLLDPSLGAAANRSHQSSVECVEVACGNHIVLSAALDGAIKMWELGSGKLREVIHTGQPISCSCVHQTSSLMIVAQHMTIRVYHCNPDVGLTAEELLTPVRELEGHNSHITALALSPDTSRYVVSSSGDGALLLWDLAAAACVGQYRLASPALSLSYHPDALFLSTTHAGEVGAVLWVNHLRYGFVPEVVREPKKRAVEELPLLHFPTQHGLSESREEDEDEDEDAAAATKKTEDTEAELFNPANDVALAQRAREKAQWEALDAIPTEGLHLAGIKRDTWFNLTLLDQIKEKNQPLLPPQKKDVPFFLPTTQELRPTFIVVANNGGSSSNADGDSSGRMRSADLTALTPVQQMLLQEDHVALMNYLTEHCRSPQVLDLEVKRIVDYVEDGEYTEAEIDRMRQCLGATLRFLTFWILRQDKVDLVQGILADVVRSHGDLIARLGDALGDDLNALAEAQNKVRYTVNHLVSYPGCLVDAFSGSMF